MSIFDDIKESVENILKKFTSNYEKSDTWREYFLVETISHCSVCAKRLYRIYLKADEPTLPEHFGCLCYLDWMRKVSIGNATNLGANGADYWLKHYNQLPDYYITAQEAKKLGWVKKIGNLNTAIPNKMIGGDVFLNNENKLPDSPGRIWYECDINYQGGYRNSERILYSNDGLIFKTDNHYKRFIAVE